MNLKWTLLPALVFSSVQLHADNLIYRFDDQDNSVSLSTFDSNITATDLAVTAPFSYAVENQFAAPPMLAVTHSDIEASGQAGVTFSFDLNVQGITGGHLLGVSTFGFNFDNFVNDGVIDGADNPILNIPSITSLTVEDSGSNVLYDAPFGPFGFSTTGNNPFGSFNIAAPMALVLTPGIYTFSFTVGFTGQVFDPVFNPDTVFAIDNVEISGARIPEPSTYAALFGTLALGIALYRRRRS